MLRLLLVVMLNFVFVASFFDSLRQALPLAGFVMAGYAAVVLSSRIGASLPLIGVVILIFAWLKRYDFLAFLPPLHFLYVVVGLSYILFRVLHLVIDVGQKAIPRPGFISYLAYVLFFPTFVSGPIQRYEDFDGQVSSPVAPGTTHELYMACQRIIRGMALIGFVTVLTHFLFERIQLRFYGALAASTFSFSTFALLCAAASLFAVHLYLNFGGYMDIVIGVGRLAGLALPENFNRPYLSRNFLEFWSRWHITLSEWFKFYLFNPLLRLMAQKWRAPSQMPYLAVLGFFVTFTVMGIWHGSTRIFLAYGLILGSGISLNKLYQVQMTAWLGKKGYKVLAGRSWYGHLCRGLTLAYFALSIVCLWIDASHAQVLSRFRGMALVFIAFAALSALTAVLSFAIERLTARLSNVPPWMPSLSDRVLPAWTAIQIFLVAVAIFSVDSNSPEFVYKVF